MWKTIKAIWTTIKIVAYLFVLGFIMAIIPHSISGSWYFWNWNLLVAFMYCLFLLTLFINGSCEIYNKAYLSPSEYMEAQENLKRDIHTEGYD